MQESVKMEKLQKPYPTDYNLSIAQDLWQDYYQILLLIILLKKFIKLHVNMDMKIKNKKPKGLRTNTASVVLSIQTLKII